MTYVLAHCPCHEEGAKKLIDLMDLRSQELKRLNTLSYLGEDSKTGIKEEHQAYLGFRMDTGLGDFMKNSLSYFSNSGA